MRRTFRSGLTWLRDLVVLLLGTMTVLFFLLRLTGDPAVVLAGPDASDEQLAQIRAEYGLDRSLPVQYVAYRRQPGAARSRRFARRRHAGAREGADRISGQRCCSRRWR